LKRRLPPVVLTLIALIILNLIAVIIYLYVGYESGLLALVRTSPSGFYSVFSSNDSVQYHAVADWIFGASARPEAAAWRPYLYPLLLGIAERLDGLRGIWLLNVLLWFTTLNVAAAATYRFVKSRSLAGLVFLALAANVSLIVLTFKGLTEIATVALLAVWIYGLSHLTRRPTPSQVAWTLLPVALLAVVKPEFELLLVVVGVVLLVGLTRSPAWKLSSVVFVACLIPVAVQVALMVHFNGYVGISTIGERTFRQYYLSRLDLAVGQTGDWQVAEQKMSRLSNIDAARFVLNHFGDAVVVYATDLKENLLAGTGFVDQQTHPRLVAATTSTQFVYFLMLLAVIPIACAALWRRRDGRLALLGVALFNLLVTGGLTFSQSDRIMIIQLPVLLITFLLAVKEVGAVEVWRLLMMRRRVASTPTVSGLHASSESGVRVGGRPDHSIERP
jgi:hypothetical protein